MGLRVDDEGDADGEVAAKMHRAYDTACHRIRTVSSSPAWLNPFSFYPLSSLPSVSSRGFSLAVSVSRLFIRSLSVSHLLSFLLVASLAFLSPLPSLICSVGSIALFSLSYLSFSLLPL